MVFLMVTIVIDNVHMVDFDDFMSMQKQTWNDDNEEEWKQQPRISVQPSTINCNHKL